MTSWGVAGAEDTRVGDVADLVSRAQNSKGSPKPAAKSESQQLVASSSSRGKPRPVMRMERILAK